MGAEEAEAFKADGNKALQSGNLTAAIENYTKAIDADGTNHVYYSNRSAAYLKKGDGNNALEDAESTIAINPGFSKGFSRKGGEFYYWSLGFIAILVLTTTHDTNLLLLLCLSMTIQF